MVTSPLNMKISENDDSSEKSSTRPLNEKNPEVRPGLYEAAENVMRLREARAECVVRNMICTVHNQEARKFTTKKKVWTKNPKTGLYGYRTKNLSVLRCDGPMATLVGTMARLDGAGEHGESNSAGMVRRSALRIGLPDQDHPD